MSGFDFGCIRLRSESSTPLFEQLSDQLRREILHGRLVGGHRLPSSRELARQLAVSRTTIVTAFDQLTAEGYLEGKIGAGTYVSDQLPEEHQIARFSDRDTSAADIGNSARGSAPDSVHGSARGSESGSERHSTRNPARQSEDAPRKTPSLNTYLSPTSRKWMAKGWTTSGFAGRPRPFQAGVPALDEFPIDVWAALYRQRWKKFSVGDISYGPPAGAQKLRTSVARYLGLHRGVRCTPDQVVIVRGTQQAVDITCRLCLDPGDPVLFEDPGYNSARVRFLSAGARIVPMPVDESGARVSDALRSPSLRRGRQAKLAYVTPSHQFPLGVTLSIERRMELIDWAQRTGGLILEDDYDSEYRYSQRPIPALQGLDRMDRTIYVGSFSKVVFPALGMGYAVVPPAMVEPFTRMLGMVGRPASVLDQIVLNDFIEEGHFDRHLRRMRGVHRSRRDALVQAIEKHATDRLELFGDEAGLHCSALFLGDADDEAVADRLADHKITAPALSSYYLKRERASSNGLVLGFASAPPDRIRAAVRKMATLL